MRQANLNGAGRQSSGLLNPEPGALARRVGVDQAPGVQRGRSFERGRARPGGTGPSPPRQARAGAGQGRAGRRQRAAVGHRAPGRETPDIPRQPRECTDQAARGPGRVRWAGPMAEGRDPMLRGGAHGRGTFKLAARERRTGPRLTQPARERRPTDGHGQQRQAHNAALSAGTAPAALAAAAAATPCRPRPPGPPRLPEVGDPRPRGQPRTPSRSGRPHRHALFWGRPARRGPRLRYTAWAGTGEGPQAERDLRGPQGGTPSRKKGDPGPGSGGMDGWAGASGVE